jgi:hypothetical protein
MTYRKLKFIFPKLIMILNSKIKSIFKLNLMGYYLFIKLEPLKKKKKN